MIGKGLSADEYPKLKTLRSNLFKWVTHQLKDLIKDMDFIGAPSKKKPKLETPNLAEKLSSAAEHTAAIKNKVDAAFAMNISNENNSSSVAGNSSVLAPAVVDLSAPVANESSVVSSVPVVRTASSAPAVPTASSAPSVTVDSSIPAGPVGKYKRSELQAEIVKDYPAILTTGVFMYYDEDYNEIIVVHDAQTNAEFKQLVYINLSKNKEDVNDVENYNNV